MVRKKAAQEMNFPIAIVIIVAVLVIAYFLSTSAGNVIGGAVNNSTQRQAGGTIDEGTESTGTPPGPGGVDCELEIGPEGYRFDCYDNGSLSHDYECGQSFHTSGSDGDLHENLCHAKDHCTVAENAIMSRLTGICESEGCGGFKETYKQLHWICFYFGVAPQEDWVRNWCSASVWGYCS